MTNDIRQLQLNSKEHINQLHRINRPMFSQFRERDFLHHVRGAQVLAQALASYPKI